MSSSSTSTSILSEFFDFDLPYESNNTPCAIPTKHKNKTVLRCEPYTRPTSTVSPSSSTDSSPPPTTNPSAFVPKYKKVAKHDLVRPLEDYGTFDPSLVLPEDPKISKFMSNGKHQFWIFLLNLLMDPSKKEVVAWTGRGREFKIISTSALASLWSEAQNMTKTVQKDSVLRNMRATYKRRIMIPVDAVHYRYAFITEPSIHVEMTRDQLTSFIETHCQTDATEDVTNASFPTPYSTDFTFESFPAPTVSPVPFETHVPLAVLNIDTNNVQFDWSSPAPLTPIDTVSPVPFETSASLPILDITDIDLDVSHTSTTSTPSILTEEVRANLEKYFGF